MGSSLSSASRADVAESFLRLPLPARRFLCSDFGILANKLAKVFVVCNAAFRLSRSFPSSDRNVMWSLEGRRAGHAKACQDGRNLFAGEACGASLAGEPC